MGKNFRDKKQIARQFHAVMQKHPKTPKQPLGPNQKAWIAALRSGKFKQTKNVLHDRNTGGMCCLGVACVLLGLKGKPGRDYDGHEVFKYSRRAAMAPHSIQKRMAFLTEYGELKHEELKGSASLAVANDRGATFKQIAAFCEKHPEAVFTKPA